MIDVAQQPWTAAALASAVAVLVAAVCTGAVQLARTYATVVNIVEGMHRAGIPVRGSHAGPIAAAYPSNTRVGGGAQAQQQIDTAAWSQLTDMQMRGSAAGAAAQDCAEECASIACQVIKRVPVPAEYIRWLWFGVFDERLASPQDLVGMLACVDIRSHERLVPFAVAQAEITRLFAAGGLAAILGYWISRSKRHWMLVVQTNSSGLVARDPWTSTLRSLSWQQFSELYADAYVHIDELSDITRPLAA